MYFINSITDTPNHENLRETIVDSMEEGVQTINLKALSEITGDSITAAGAILRNDWGIANPNSPGEVIGFLKNTGVPEVEAACCKDGVWSSKADGLKELAKMGYGFAIDLLTYRKVASYSKAVASLMGLADRGMRVHPKVSVLKTNRLSYSNPALMNIPKGILWTVIGPRTPGFRLVSVDIHQQEPLIVINMLRIERLRDLMEQYDDFYTALFLDIYGRECTNAERSEIKMCWNASTYGASKKMLVERCHFIDGGAVYTYLHGFKEFNEYINRAWGMAKRDVQTVETYFGTPVTADKAGSQLRRSLLDIPIQGCGADILALLVEHFQEEVEQRELQDDIKLYYTRHDECVLEVSEDLVERIGEQAVVKILSDIFTHAVDDWTTFRVAVKFHEPDLEMLNGTSGVIVASKNDIGDTEE